jgi:CRP-like cAMP-binding protein
MNNHLELAAVSVCVYEAITARERAGRAVPPFMRALEQKLAAEVRWHEELFRIAGDLVDDVSAVSQPGPRLVGNTAELVQEKKITASQAAELLGYSRRHVVRIATSLDGELVCGRWLFSEAAVLEYRDGRADRN